MRMIGFSTGALARGDYRRALRMLANKDVNAVELSALRLEELRPLVEDLDNLDLRKFRYVAFHAPSSLDPSFEAATIKLLEHVAGRGWTIIVHPNAMHNPCGLGPLRRPFMHRKYGQTEADRPDCGGSCEDL
jgi:hypothetical protein